MGTFFRLDPRRLAADSLAIVGDARDYCEVYRRPLGEDAESKVAEFWGRIANVGRQTTGLERSMIAGSVTGALWVLRVPAGVVPLQHEDEIRTNGTRWRIIHVRPSAYGQVCILSNTQ